MSRPRREVTVPVRIRQSSHGVAKRIAAQYHLSLTDAFDVGMRAWGMLIEEQRAEITGTERERLTPGEVESEMDGGETEGEEDEGDERAYESPEYWVLRGG